MNREELIQDYLHGRLDKEGLAEFDMLYEKDMAFREEAEFHKDLKTAFASIKRDELKTKLKGFEEELQSETSKTQTLESENGSRKLENKRIGSNYKAWLAAACVLVIIGLGLMYFDKPSANELYLAHFEPYPNVVNPLTRGESGKNLADSSFIAYEKGDNEQAAVGFAQLYAETGKSYFLLYQANAFLANGQAEKAIPLLKKQLAFQDQFAAKSKWYLALAFLKTGELEKAENLLREIETGNSYKAEGAGNILDELE